jgi:hypothetical protein
MSSQQSVKLPLVIVAIAGLIGAVFAGNWIANEEFLKVGIIAAFLVVLGLLGFARRQLLAIGLLTAVLDFWAAPIGFKTSAMEQTFALAILVWITVAWRTEIRNQQFKPYQNLNAYRFFRFAVIVTCAYAALHFFFNKNFPYEALAFSITGASKTYLQVFGPFLMIIILMDSGVIRPGTEKSSVFLLRVFAFGLYILLSLKLFHVIRFGTSLNEGLDMVEKAEAMRAFTIPVINVWDNIYSLRSLGPAAALVGATFLFAADPFRHKILAATIMIGGLVGTVLGAGRASLAFGVIFVMLAAAHAGRKVEVFMATMLVVATLAISLILPANIIEQLPWHVQRSIGMLRPDVKTSATMSIQGSSDMRVRYFKYAWEYWANGPVRLLFLGRSVSGMDATDAQSFQLGNESAVMFFAIRRLATHSGLTDMLIGFGFLGYLLSVIVWVALFWTLSEFGKKFIKGSHGDCWTFIAKVFFAWWAIYSQIAGSFVWPLAIWFSIAALNQTAGLKTLIAPKDKSETSPDRITPTLDFPKRTP